MKKNELFWKKQLILAQTQVPPIFPFSPKNSHFHKLNKKMYQINIVRWILTQFRTLETPISSEFLLCNKKIFTSKLRIFSFISEKILSFLDIYLSSYKNFRHLLHGCNIRPKRVKLMYFIQIDLYFWFLYLLNF